MKTLVQRFCPLCGRACRRAALYVHINSDSALIVSGKRDTCDPSGIFYSSSPRVMSSASPSKTS